MSQANLRQLDQRLAGELQKRKVQSEMERIKIRMAIEGSSEIKHIKGQIAQAYLNKDRSAQIVERQTRNLVEQTEEALIDRAMLEKRDYEVEANNQHRKQKTMSLLQHKAVLHDQMYEKKVKCEEARDQFLSEKGQVDDILQKIINEDSKKMQKDLQKKTVAFATMQTALAEKEEIKRDAKERERLENLAYKKYLDSLEQREYEFKLQKAELEAAKDKIYQQMKVRQEHELAEQELLDNLREELHKEEEEAKARKKDQDMVEKRAHQMMQMKHAEVTDRQMKEDRRREERKLEVEYKEIMLKKFAEDAKLEQMIQSKRRMKELEHKREVEKMWQQRLELYRIEREKELAWEKDMMKKDDWLDEIVKMEKERLLQENLPYIDGFLPKGMVKNEEDCKYFGVTRDFHKAANPMAY